MRPLLLAALLAAGCRPPVPVEDPGRVVAWRLVEIETAGGPELVFEQGPEPSPKIEVRLSHRRAAVGTVVAADVWLPDATGSHRIRIRPGRPGVRILGPDAFDVRGSEIVTVRFTCGTAGRGGILIVVRERWD